jgi:exodeoxyribonuclease VII large subunit
MHQRLAIKSQALAQQHAALKRLSPRARLDVHRQQVDDQMRLAGRLLAHQLDLHRSGLAGLEARLEALGPLATLERGYAVVRREDTGEVISSVDQVCTGDPLAIRVRDGEFAADARAMAND